MSTNDNLTPAGVQLDIDDVLTRIETRAAERAAREAERETERRIRAIGRDDAAPVYALWVRAQIGKAVMFSTIDVTPADLMGATTTDEMHTAVARVIGQRMDVPADVPVTVEEVVHFATRTA